jgi:hypothetical protein
MERSAQRIQASSCSDTMARPFGAAGSKAMIQRSLLSVERTTTKACFPSSDQIGARRETSRSFVFAFSFSVFCSRSCGFSAEGATVMPCSNHFTSPFASLSTAMRDDVCTSPTFSRPGIVST